MREQRPLPLLPLKLQMGHGGTGSPEAVRDMETDSLPEPLAGLLTSRFGLS